MHGFQPVLDSALPVRAASDDDFTVIHAHHKTAVRRGKRRQFLPLSGLALGLQEEAAYR